MSARTSLSAAVLAVALTSSHFAHAAEPPADDARRREALQRTKECRVEHLDARIRIMQATQDCVRAAADMESIGICHAQERRQTKALRDNDRQDIESRRSDRREGKVPAPGPARD